MEESEADVRCHRNSAYRHKKVMTMRVNRQNEGGRE